VRRVGRRLIAGSFISATLLLPATAFAADLQRRTAQAYDRYADETTKAFVARARNAAVNPRCEGVMIARAGGSDGILDVPDGLVHHWMASAYLKGATLPQVTEVARDYPGYPKIHKNVVSAKVLSQQNGSYRVLLRLKEGEAGVDAVLDVRSAVDYQSLNDGSIAAVSKSEEIRQVENAGQPDETLLPAGHDSGYLWRAHTFSFFTADREGVFVVMETLGLSRRFPRFTGWFLEPIARRIGRKSVEGSLNEFLAGIRRSAGLPAPKVACA
jgi:hypothetical protein